MSPGIHLLHKPIGPTSFSIVQEFRAKLEPRPGRRALRICHGGTLDPFASGLLLILLEPATRLFDYLHDIPKVYEAAVRWGAETDNGDPHGAVTFNGDPSSLRPDALDAALPPFIGWREQIPHATSARRVGGERAYVKAHRGELVAMPPSRVYLHQAQWLSHDLPHQSRLRITVRGGYYVRALVRDLGRALGCGAHVSALRRLAIGPWDDPGEDKTRELHGRDLLPWLPSRELIDGEVSEIRAGRDIQLLKPTPPAWQAPAGFPPPAPLVRAFHLGKFRFLMKIDGDRLQLISPLPGGL